LGEHVQEIGRQAFAYCTSLSSINLTNNLRKIGAEAFRECAALTKVTVPDSVQYIGDKAFAVCTGLEELSVPFIGEKRDNPEYPYFCYIITGEDTWWIDGMPQKLKTILSPIVILCPKTLSPLTEHTSRPLRCRRV
jgi:hypothetical protein